MTTVEQRAWAEAVAAAAGRAPPPELDALWRALDEVPDPEVPAVSVVELGIVRAIEWENGESPTLVVRLRGYGIAPPATGAAVPVDVSALRRPRPAAAVRCPRCGSERTRVLSQFGSTACKAQYRCDACLEPFDYFKPH